MENSEQGLITFICPIYGTGSRISGRVSGSLGWNHYGKTCYDIRLKSSVQRAKMCDWFSLKLSSKTFFIIGIQRDSVINVKTSCTVSVFFLSDSNKTCIFSTYFRKKLKYKVSSISVQWEPSCSLRTDGQTDMTILIVAFRYFANAPKKWAL